jgi:macrolide-specific efflux system membrane fusion protein
MILNKQFKFLILILALLIVIGGVYFWKQREQKQQAAKQINVVSVEVGNIEESVTAQGKLEPKEYVDVGVQVSGQLKKIYVEIGDVVKKNELLAEIDPAVYKARVEASTARYKSLQAQLEEQKAQIILARQQYERNQRLITSKAVSQEALENTQAALQVAEARATSLQAQIDEAKSSLEGDQANLGYTKIYAPMDGTIVTLPAREGQTLNANQTAPLVLRVANLDIMTVRAQVAEADVMRLNPGMEAYFTTLGAPEKKWFGKVRKIEPSPEIINDVVLYDALVDVQNKDRLLMPNMSTQVFFIIGKAENVLVIPVGALGRKNSEGNQEEGQSYQVRVRENGQMQNRTIHIGLMTRTLAEVKDGLKEGEEVILTTPTKSEQSSRPQQRQGMRRGPQL